MAERTTFRVETLTDGTVDMEFDADTAESLRRLLPQASATVACVACGNLAPITGGIPRREMPPCARCDEPMVGVVEVTELESETNDE